MWNQLVNDIMRYIDRMDFDGWVLALAALIIVGIVCMRGFGSRSGY